LYHISGACECGTYAEHAPHSTTEQSVGWNEIIEEPVLLDARIKFTRIDEHEFDGSSARQLEPIQFLLHLVFDFCNSCDVKKVIVQVMYYFHRKST
jgi:hypothetical protein